MALLKAQAEKLSEDDLVRGVIEEVIDRDDLFAVLPFKHTSGKAYVYNREGSVVEAEFLDPNDPIPEGAATFNEVIARLRILAHDVDVDKFLDGTMSDAQSQLAIQLAAKAKGIARKFRKTLILGDNATNAKEFDGVGQLANAVGASQTVAASATAGALTMSMLDELCDAIPNGADVIFMRPGTIRAYRALLRASGGTSPAEIMIPNFGRPMLTHNGVPILANEFIPVTTSGADTTAPVYAARLNIDDGLHGIYGGNAAGFHVEDIGTVQNKDAYRYRVKWYAGLALKSTRSIARLTKVSNV